MFYHADTDTLYNTNALLNMAGLTIKDVITVITKQPESYDPDYQSLDFETGSYDKKTNEFTYGAKHRAYFVNFDSNGKFLNKGWSKNAVEVTRPLFDFIDKNYTLSDGKVKPPSITYLKKQLEESVSKFAEESREKLIKLTNSTNNSRLLWSGKERRAEHIVNNTATERELLITQAEADTRKRSETALQLAEKTLSKATAYSVGGVVIDGMEDAAIDALSNARSESELFAVLIALKATAKVKFAEIAKNFS